MRRINANTMTISTECKSHENVMNGKEKWRHDNRYNHTIVA